MPVPEPPSAAVDVGATQVDVDADVVLESGVRKDGGMVKLKGWPLKYPTTGMPGPYLPSYAPSQLPSEFQPRLLCSSRGRGVLNTVTVVRLARVIVSVNVVVVRVTVTALCSRAGTRRMVSME